MPEEEQSGEVTKQTYRKSTWDYMIKNGVSSYPTKSYRRGPSIPNFTDAEKAAQRLCELKEFKDAKVIKMNPDKSQEPLRMLALDAGKEILIPIPRLESGLFVHLKPSTDGTLDNKTLISRRDLEKYGEVLSVDSKVKVDLVVMGSVCVSKLGQRIGNGMGFGDLEFAMMMRMGAVNNDTVVVTTVHDCQVVDSLEPAIFQKHDVPVDIIVTPTQTIVVSERLKKPEGIFWDSLTARRIKSMQILQQFRDLDEKDGKDVTLKPDDVREPRPRRTFDRRFSRKSKDKKRSKSKDGDEKTDGEQKNDGKSDTDGNKDQESRRNKRTMRKRRPKTRKSEKTDSTESPVKEDNKKPVDKPQRRKQSRYKPRADIDFSLRLSNIKRNVRVRELKDALIARGVRPTDITWLGHRGYCYLHFGKLRKKDAVPNEPVQVDSIVANLQQLRIGDNNDDNGDHEFILVEPAKPVTRIETTDVTAV